MAIVNIQQEYKEMHTYVLMEVEGFLIFFRTYGLQRDTKESNLKFLKQLYFLSNLKKDIN